MHIIGTAFGAGGATASDFMFFQVVRDKKIESNELDMLKTVSRVVWIGFVVLIISGLGFLVLGYYGGYLGDLLGSAKLQAKLTIVLIIFINGVLFHTRIFPIFKALLNHDLSSDKFVKNSRFIFSAGAISIVSWYSALILGAWRGIEASYPTIIGVYLAILLTAIVIANIVGKRLTQKK
jgi:hypothetical protein